MLQREEAWRAQRLEQARQALERDTGQAHTFASTERVAGRLVDRVELAGEEFGRVQDRDRHLVLVPWTREMAPHLERLCGAPARRAAAGHPRAGAGSRKGTRLGIRARGVSHGDDQTTMRRM